MSVLFVRLPACLSCFCLSLFFLYLSSSPYPILCPSFSLLLSHFPPFLFFLSLYSHSSPNPSTLSPLLPLLLFYPLPPLSLPLPVPFSSPAVSRDTPCRKAGMQKPPPPSTQAQEADGGIFVYTWLRRAEGGVSHMTPIQMRSTFIFPCRFLYLLCPYLYIYLDIYMRTYAHTYIHAEVHTYIHTYVFFFLFVCRVCVCVSVYMCVSLRACVFMRRDSNFRSHDTASRAKTFRTFRPTPRIRRGRLVEA